MFSIIILAIFAIGLIASVGYAVISQTQATMTLVMIQEDAQNLGRVAAALEANLRPVTPGGPLRAPLGTASSAGYMTLPAWLPVAGRSPWGADYLYCPYAPQDSIAAGTGAVTVVSGPDGESYTVDTAQSAMTQGADYVAASETPPVAGVIAILASADINAATPSCASLLLSGGDFQLAGGNVRVITSAGADIHSQSLNRNTALTLYITPNGSGSGLHAGDRISLSGAVGLWKTGHVDSAVFDLAAGTYTVPAGLLEFGGTLSEKRMKSLALAGAGRAAVTLNPEAGQTFTFSAPGMRLTVSGLTFGAGSVVLLEGNDAQIEDVGVASFSATDSTLTLTGEVHVTAPDTAGYPLVTDGSRLILNNAAVTITGAASNLGGMALLDSWATLNGSTLALSTPQLGIHLGDHSRMTMNGGSVTTQYGSAIDKIFNIQGGSSLTATGTQIEAVQYVDKVFSAAGPLILNQVSIHAIAGVDTAFQISQGGSLSLNNSQVGSSTHPFEKGVSDGGATFLLGTNTSFYLTDMCWSGPAFSCSTAGNSSANSGSGCTDFEAVKFINKSSWACY